MRIIIEIDKEGRPVQVEAEPEADTAQEMDGGGPAGMLLAALGAQGSEQPESDPSAPNPAGAPPDWLILAIEAAMAGDVASDDAAGTEDGGAAPG